MMKRRYLFRHYLRYAQSVAWAVLLFACSDDSPNREPEGSMETVRITIQTRADDTDIPPREENEYRIQTLRMYVFSEDGKLLKDYYKDYSDNPSDKADFILTLPTGTHTFYTIANEKTVEELKKNNGVNFTFPEQATEITPADLESLTFSKLPEAKYDSGGDENSKDETNKVYNSPLLPMASKQKFPVSPNGFVNISLTRSVAKMQLYFTTTGAGECYMGRGLYLYNEPQYGYLFPRDTYDGTIDRKEDDRENRPTDFEYNEFYNDSYLNQLNGRIILRCGWPQEPESYSDTEHTEAMKQLDINQITANMNDPTTELQYDYLPQKSFYLFANPNQSGEESAVTAKKPEGQGYYLKILVHQHGAGQSGVELHKGEIFYLSLPVVKANDRLSIYSTVTLDGHVSITPHWMVQEWQTGGGTITFN